MSMDDFEQKLARQELRQPPAAWREEILSAVHANAPQRSSTSVSDAVTGWQLLLRKFPMAWGAVAAIWVLVIGINSFLSGGTPARGQQSPMLASKDPASVWSLQRAQIGLMANGQADLPDELPRSKQAVPATRPRSDRREDHGFGEMYRDESRVWLV